MSAKPFFKCSKHIPVVVLFCRNIAHTIWNKECAQLQCILFNYLILPQLIFLNICKLLFAPQLTYRRPAQNGVLTDQLCQAIYCIHLSIMPMQIIATIT